MHLGTKKGRISKSFYTKNGGQVEFDDSGSFEELWAEGECKSPMEVCPKKAKTFGPFDDIPEKILFMLKDRFTTNKKGKEKKLKTDSFFAGQLEVHVYDVDSGPSSEVEKCTKQGYTPFLLKGSINNRKYNLVPPGEKCPCKNEELKQSLSFNLNEDSMMDKTTKVVFEIYYPCREEWATFNYNVKPPKNGVKDSQKSGIKEYPTKLRVIAPGRKPIMEYLEYKFVPNMASPSERILIHKTGSASKGPHVDFADPSLETMRRSGKDVPYVEYDLTYSLLKD